MRTDKEQLLRLRIAAEKKTKERDFWLDRLSGEWVKSSFPAHYNYKREGTEAYAKANVSFKFPDELSSGLLELGTGSDVRLYIILAASLTILINRYTGGSDIIVGTPILKSDIKPNLLNTVLALRNRLADHMTVKGLLLEVRQTILEANKNRNYPIEVLAEQLNLPPGDADFPLFDVAILVENVHDKEHLRHVNPNMIFSFLRGGNAISGYVEYNSLLYAEIGVKRIIDHLKNLLGAVIESGDIKVVDIEILSGDEKKQLLIDFNDTAAEYPRGKTVHELFEEQAAGRPDGTAVLGQIVGAQHAVPLPTDHVSITYKELNEKANHLAFHLRTGGVGSDSIVGIMVERSIEMIVGILGILKAGGAYLPVDPGYPRDRIDYMLADSNARVLLKKSEIAQRPNTNFEFRASNLKIGKAEPSNLAYVIYTSGSTGKPKGVMTGHRALVNRLNWMQRAYPIGEGDVILQKTPFTFDVSVWELLWWGIVGASLCFLEPGGEKSPGAILAAVEKNNITTMHFVPSMLNVFLEYLEGPAEVSKLSSLRQVFSSGEALTVYHVERFKNVLAEVLQIRLINLYGPTEAAIDVSYFNCVMGGSPGLTRIPIGRPIDNIRLVVLGKNVHVQPVGAAGELCISGIGLARGYLNRPELTAETFVLLNHEATKDTKEHEENNEKFLRGGPGGRRRLYKTGDLARWLPDGNIEFLGRMDHQVKIRGFRIELGEIENQLQKHPGIGAVVVVAASGSSETGGKEDLYLCAYVVPAAGAVEKSPDSRELKEFLSRMLPDYMVPLFFIPLDKIPLTPSGKLDRRALPAPATVSTGVEYTAPRDMVEVKLAEIWSDVLHVERIGIDDNFLELGGHSLRAAALISKIYKAFDVNVTLANLFKNPTVRGLAGIIKKEAADEFPAVDPVEEKDYYLLSPAQKRLYILQQSDKNDISYNMPQVMALEGELTGGHLEGAFKKLIERHESFRTSFVMRAGVPVQRIHKRVGFEVERLAAAAGEENIEDMIRGFLRPFDLSRPPLLRVGLIEIKERKHILMIDMHHIVADGNSLEIYIRELMALQAGQGLPALQIQYKDFSERMNDKSMRALIEKQEEYWLNEFKKGVPVLQLYVDEPDFHSHSRSSSPPRGRFRGNRLGFELDRPAAEGLKKLAKEEGVTVYMVLLAIYNILLFKAGGQEDIVVGTVTAGRPHPGLQPVIGMFVNTLAPRNYPGGDRTFREFLGEVKEKILEAFENQSYPFEAIAEKVAAERAGRRNPLFDVMFTLQDLDIPTVEIPGLALKPYEYENVISKFDLSLNGVGEDDKFVFSFEYRTDRFKKGAIECLADYYRDIIAGVLKDRDVKLADIELSIDISDSEADAKAYQEAYGDFEF
jgi:tyrocidine synthetase-3